MAEREDLSRRASERIKKKPVNNDGLFYLCLSASLETMLAT
jgi:hypothetical protein